MLLHYEHPGSGSVLGLDFEQHFLDVPDHLTAAVLENPHWRPATDEEQAAFSAPDGNGDSADGDGETFDRTSEDIDRRPIRSPRRTRPQAAE